MRNYKKIAGIFVILLCFYFIGRMIYTNWSKVDFSTLHFIWYNLILSYIFWTVSLLYGSFIWWLMLRKVQTNIPYLSATSALIYAGLSRFIPGKIWVILSRVYIIKKEGASAEKGFITITYETIMSLLAGIIISLISMTLSRKFDLPKIWFIIILVCGLLIMSHPKFLGNILKFTFKKLKRKMPTYPFGYLDTLKFIVFYSVYWVLFSMGVWFLTKSLGICKLSLLTILSAFPVSWVIGFLSIVTPGGLGVREGILAYLFSLHVQPALASIIAVLIRLWGVSGNLIAFLFFIKRLKKYIS